MANGVKKKRVLANYTRSNHASKSRNAPTIIVGNMKLSWVGSILGIFD